MMARLDYAVERFDKDGHASIDIPEPLAQILIESGIAKIAAQPSVDGAGGSG